MNPPRTTVPIIQYLMRAYELWHGCTSDIPKSARYTLGGKIDALLIETIEAAFIASYLHIEKKLPYIERAVVKLDLVKLFLQVAWRIKALDNKKYTTLSESLDEIGRMLGGWTKQVMNRTQPVEHH